MPQVSIIIPVFNKEKVIRKIIESVLNQSFKDLEIIVVDDCSTDTTPLIIERLRRNDNRIKFIRLEKNSGGPAKPRNEGIKIASGEYIFFLDSDYLLFPTSIQERFDIFKSKNVDIINSNAWVADLNEKRIINVINGTASCLSIKAEIFKKIGFLDEELTGVDELEFIVRYKLFTNKEIFLFEKPTIIHLQDYHPQILGLIYEKENIEKFINRNLLLLKKLENLLKNNNKNDSYDYLNSLILSIYFRLGYGYGLLGKFKEMKY
ncbi:MAG: glycosyltransferase family 2 protein, partial [bacterium]